MNQVRSSWVWVGGVAIVTACGSAGDPTESPQSASEAAIGPKLCAPTRCGPVLGTPNTLCPDGVTVAGPTGRCLRTTNTSCAWEVVACPAKACASSSQCNAGEYCTTTTGVCNPAPGCGAGRVCTQLCYGTCESNTAAE